MGWFWQDSAPAAPSSSQGTAQPPPRPARDSKATESRSDADPEVARFLEDLMGELKSAESSASERPPAPKPAPAESAEPAAASSSPPAPSAPAESSSSWSSLFSSSSTSADTPSQRATEQQSPEAETRLSPLAESLLPTTMSCEQAFNQAFYCQSLGGQFNNIYRYGAVRPCSENWDDFWFCMRQKGSGEGTVRDDMVREHYRRKHLAKYGSGKPNSEDVWRERAERLPPGTAFTEPVEAPTVSDAEYQKWEMERADRIRSGGSS